MGCFYLQKQPSFVSKYDLAASPLYFYDFHLGP